MQVKKYYASEFAKLNSSVCTGGGSDDTKALQAILDKAKDENEGVHLIMDGASLITQLQVYSNTTIECLTKDCGFYQKKGSNRPMLVNADWDRQNIVTRNITLSGGTYHQNGQNQEKHNKNVLSVTKSDFINKFGGNPSLVHGIEMHGVENLYVHDLTICDFRNFAFAVGCFRNVKLENVWLDQPFGTRGNQDGFHFWGPGQFLTILNSGGKVGDDIINVGPDEEDTVSSITDVLIDGIFVDDGEQAVRILSRGTGRVDRVTVRNVSGVYRSYGFYINSHFVSDHPGNFGNIFIENVDLKSLEKSYEAPPFLFSVGGNIECLTLKNIRHHNAHDNRPVVNLGFPFYLTNPENYKEKETEDIKKLSNSQRMQTIIIDGLTITEKSDEPLDTSYINVYDKVENLVVKNVIAVKEQPENGTLIHFEKDGCVDNLILESIHTKGLKTIVDDESKVKSTF